MLAPAENLLEIKAESAMNDLRDYYDNHVSEAASAVEMAALESRDECLDAQASIATTAMVDTIGNAAILCGLSSDKSRKNLWQYGLAVDAEGNPDFKKIAALMFRDDVLEELQIRVEERSGE